ncbi:MAG: DNA internalization-related competence protein ComEC/Rec2 [Lachnospiraceae bacterium]|nr:DNA internalization-related competence protein ComEC/Rec2 [Lachnospiraceae bacterium]
MIRRPLFFLAVFLVLGEFLACKMDYGAYFIMAGMIVPAVFFMIRSDDSSDRKKKRREWIFILLPAAGIIGVFCYRFASSEDELTAAAAAGTSSPTVQVEAGVDWVQEKEYGFYVYLTGASVCLDGQWYANQQIVWSTENGDRFYPGDRVVLTGELETFERASNPGEFDSRSYYRGKGYDWLIQTEQVWMEEETGNVFLRLLWELRLWMKENIRRSCTEETAGVYQAVFLGESSLTDKTLKTLFQEQGIAHLLAVSGLHISIVGMTFYRLIRRMSGSFVLAAFGGGFLVICYGILVGGSVSAVRAVIMYLVQAAAACRGRVYDTATSMSLSAIVIAVTQPLIVTQASFLLSFVAVLGLSAVTEIWNSFLLQKERSGFLSVIAMQQAMLPVLLTFFSQYPLYSILINQLVLPFGGFLIAAAAAAAVLPGAAGQLAGWAGSLLIDYFQWICRLFERLPGASQINGKPAFWRIAVLLVVFSVLAFAAGQYRKQKKRRYSVETVPDGVRLRRFLVRGAAFLVLIAEALFLRADPVSQLEITMLDVGQGDGCLIRMPGGINLLSDGGSSSEKNLAQYTLEPVLYAKGIRSLDAVFLSHSDADHVNGVTELLTRGNIRICRLILPDYPSVREDFSEVIALAEEAGCPVLFLGAGEHAAFGEIRLEILHPEKGETYGDTNDSSLVFRLDYGDFSMLFTGDISSEQEMELNTGVDVLKVAHHGSRYSSSQTWLSHLDASAAVISCGAENSYGHPHEEVLVRLKEAGMDCYVTAESGAVTITTDGKRFWLDEYLK